MPSLDRRPDAVASNAWLVISRSCLGMWGPSAAFALIPIDPTPPTADQCKNGAACTADHEANEYARQSIRKLFDEQLLSATLNLFLNLEPFSRYT